MNTTRISSASGQVHVPNVNHAIVIGGSLAGLLAGRVLADHFERVTILERDDPPESPSPRKGVPQARHLHIMLARGQIVLERLFPGLVGQLTALGAPVADIAKDLAWLTPKGWGVRCNSGIGIVGCSRDLLEWCVRQRLAQAENVRFVGGCDVIGMTSHKDGNTLSGVIVRIDNDCKVVEGVLVVDASGRGSRVPQWLEQLGYDRPAETVVNAFLGYTSRVYRRSPLLREWKGAYVQPAPPDHTRGGALFPVEGDRWILTLAGYGRDYPPTDESGFLEFARSLRTPIIYGAIKDAEPLSPILSYRATENRLRHYERMPRQPEGLVVLGDAACAFNPVYAQGMTMAALGALTLDGCLHEQTRRRPNGDLRGLARSFQAKLAKVNSVSWLLATSEDQRVHGWEGEAPARITKYVQRYFDSVVLLSTRDSAVRRKVLRVFNMLKSPITLLHPKILLLVLLELITSASRSSSTVSRPEELGEATW